MTGRDPRFAGGRVWGAVIVVAVCLVGIALAVTIGLTLLIAGM